MLNPTRTLVLGVAGGLVIGATAGLLLAPKSGSELRSMLREQAQKWVSDVVDFFTAMPEAQPVEVNLANSGLTDTDRRRADELMREANDILHGLKNTKEA
jgi:gas vesicle protein